MFQNTESICDNRISFLLYCHQAAQTCKIETLFLQGHTDDNNSHSNKTLDPLIVGKPTTANEMFKIGFTKITKLTMDKQTNIIQTNWCHGIIGLHYFLPKLYFKGVLQPNSKLACFVLYLKIINTLKNNICIYRGHPCLGLAAIFAGMLYNVQIIQKSSTRNIMHVSIIVLELPAKLQWVIN